MKAIFNLSGVYKYIKFIAAVCTISYTLHYFAIQLINGDTQGRDSLILDAVYSEGRDSETYFNKISNEQITPKKTPGPSDLPSNQISKNKNSLNDVEMEQWKKELFDMFN